MSSATGDRKAAEDTRGSVLAVSHHADRNRWTHDQQRVHRQNELPIGRNGGDDGVTAYVGEGSSTTYERGRWSEYEWRPEYAAFVCGRGGFSAHPSRRHHPWRVGDLELTVSLWLDPKVRYIVWVHAGWPKRSAPNSLLLAAVYAITLTGRLEVPEAPSLARWQTRALMDAGLITRPPVGLGDLPPNAPGSVRAAWPWIDLLFAVRVANGGLNDPLVLDAPFLQGWSGNTVPEATFVAAKRWLQAHGYITHVGDAPGKFGKPTKLWGVRVRGFSPEGSSCSSNGGGQ